MNELKEKLLNKETISYLIFGVLTTAIDFIVYIIFRKLFDINYLASNVISWTVAVLFAYITNKIFVFQSKSVKFKVLMNEITSFVGARVFSLVFNLLFIYLCVILLGINDIVAKIFASVFVVIINYILSKFFIFNKEEKDSKTLFTWIKDNITFIVAFIIPVAILIVIYYLRKIFPFGDEMYLRSDCYHQYAPFHKELFNKLKNGGSLSYSWNIGMGMNFSALYAYYLASPVNWFIAIFPEKYIVEVMNSYIIVKSGLCSFGFAYYISKKFKTKQISIAAFAVFYALSSYFAAFSWNVMWLDCLVLLPFILLGLERLVKENKCFLYCISLGLAIVSNYYISIMICIFCVFYFIVLIYSDNAQKKLAYYVNKTLHFGVYSMLSGGFAAAVFLPAFFALKSTASGNFGFPELLQNYFSVFFLISRSLMNVEASIFEAHDPNVYCTVAVFLLIPLYFMCNKIDYKEKIAKAALLGFMIFSFNTNIPNYIWHGFHFPNSLPCRQSFIYIFLMVAMSYEAFLHIRSFTNKQLFGTFAGAIGLVLMIEQMFVGDDYEFKIIYYSVAYIILYMIAFMLYRSPNYKRGVIVFFIFVITISETYFNLYNTGISTTGRTYYMEDNKDIKKLVSETKDDSSLFFRIEKANRRSKNDAGWSNYHGASTFSSTAPQALSEFYGQIGMEESTNAYAYYGHTPLTEALLSVKYVLNDNYVDEDDLISYRSTSGSLNLYENNYVLPLGYMLPEDFEDMWDYENSDPFAVQNSFADVVMDDEDNLLFTRLDVESDGCNAEVTASEDMHLYVYVTTSLDSVTVEKYDVNGENTDTSNISDMTHSHTLDLGYFNEGQKVIVTSNDSEVDSLQLYAYSFDQERFIDVFNKLNSQPFNVEKLEDTYVKGSISVTEDGDMLTSIPYDAGWSAYVDGTKVETSSLEGALLTVPLEAGNHVVELKFCPQGRNLGITITILSIMAFISIIIYDYQKKKRDTIINNDNL